MQIVRYLCDLIQKVFQATCAEHRGQNRKRNDPLPSFLETIRIKEGKAPQHLKTRRSHLIELLVGVFGVELRRQNF